MSTSNGEKRKLPTHSIYKNSSYIHGVLEILVFFFFNDRATPEFYPFSLHDALPICPPAVHDFLQVADQGQHREHRLDQHAVLPLAPLAEFQVRRIALRRMEGGVAQNNHLLLERSEEHTSELQSQSNLVCRLLLQKKN